jgi:hypothetical protein
MGQYFLVVNLDKKEFLHPHRFGDGLKLLEFGCSMDGTMTALAILLRKSSEDGGGDIHIEDELIGSWAENRIVIIGDYDNSKLFEKAKEEYKDISKEIIKVMKKDGIDVRKGWGE